MLPSRPCRCYAARPPRAAGPRPAGGAAAAGGHRRWHGRVGRAQPRLAPRLLATWGGSEADSADLLERLSLLQRQLDEAVASEDYSRAAELKQAAQALREALPPVAQFLQGQLAKLRSGEPGQQAQAIKALAEVGDESCLADLAACLHSEALAEAASQAMWAIFGRHPSQQATNLVARGAALMESGGQLSEALRLFDDACKLEPSWAEAHNKRATVLYLLKRYQDSIDVCRLVLELNPWHFGAASGMGLCFLGLQDLPAALAAFEATLAINPSLSQIQHFRDALKANLPAEGEGGAGAS